MALSIRANVAQEKLFNLYDQLNALWTEAERQFTEFHVPQIVKYKFGVYGGESEWLGLYKISGKWRICYDQADEKTGPWDWFPIVECSADIRTRAAKHIAGLRQAVVESSEAYIPVVEEAIALLSSALKTPLPEDKE